MNEIADTLLQNENLLKWITYLVDDPLSLPEVPKNKVLGSNIILTRVNLDILPKAATKIYLIPKGGVDHTQGYLTDTVFELSILSPFASSYIYSRRIDRFAEIASEIAISLDGKHITGVGDMQVSSNFKTYKLNETYSSMMLHVTVTNQRMRK